MTTQWQTVENDFELSLQKRPEAGATAVQAMTGRYLQEVQGMVFMSKQYPRDQFACWQRIKEACSRKTLAEGAEYEFPRGDKKVTGPSIRLAEVLAQSWGNMSHGVIELEQRPGSSTAMAFAWDLETNTRVEKIFEVKHERSTKKGVNVLTDPRDIYEMVANYGARRQRACILAVIPSDVTDKAIQECHKTLLGDNKEPLFDRLRTMMDKLKEFGVTLEMVEKLMGYKLTLFTERDGMKLWRIYTSLKDGMARREDIFEVEGPAGKSEPSAEDEKLKAEFKKAQAATKAGAGGVQQAEMRVPGQEG